ncbi:MAG: DUF4097 domain-containing protein [Clostridia bacterium]|jgi:DUF4097 and DUF4098 domain-containing protein YvlB|nr:DUF4097 domain-containing protein [Clostridia bacterium]
MKSNGIKIVLVIVSILIIMIIISAVISAIVYKNKEYKIKFLGIGYKEKMIFQNEYDASNVENIEIVAQSSNIKFVEGDSNKVKVTVYGLEGERIKETFEGKKLKIQKQNHTIYLLGIFFWSRQEMIIELPKENYHKIQAKTTSGKIEVVDIEQTDLELETSSGNITCSRAKNVNLKSTSGNIYCGDVKSANLKSTSGSIKVGNVEENANIKSTSGGIMAGKLAKATIETTSGKIEAQGIEEGETKSTSGTIKIVKANSITAKTTSGSIRFETIDGFCNLSSKSGSIKIGSIKISENSSIQATSGNVKIEEATNMYIDTQTTSGSIKVNENNRKAEVELRIRTTSGSVSVKRTSLN